MDNLHDALLLEILTRLPAKSLGQLKCVNKHYNHLILSPFFQTMQAQRSIDNVLGLFHVTRHTEGGTALYFPLDDNPDSHVNLSEQLSPFRPPVSIMASCNGLLLGQFGDSRKFFICNPTTKKYQVLWHLRVGDGYGLAVDLVTYKYKVVCISASHLAMPGSIEYQFKVYSSRKDRGSVSKMKLSCCCSQLLPLFVPFYFNGALHWLREIGDIIAFNVESEGARVIQLPAGAVFSSREGYYSKMWLGLVGCFINLVQIMTDRVNVWVLGDYEKVEWRMKGEIKMGPPMIIGMSPRITNDEILLFFDGERFVTGVFGPKKEIYIYNIRNKTKMSRSIPVWVDHCRCFFPYISNEVDWQMNFGHFSFFSSNSSRTSKFEFVENLKSEVIHKKRKRIQN